MQHISHIFIGEDLISFRDEFASIYRRLHADQEESLFSALSLTLSEGGQIALCPDKSGDKIDAVTINKEDEQSELINFFEDMYGRRVTVAHPGNQSMVIVIWAKLYNDNVFEIIQKLTDTITCCTSKIFIEVTGFTNDAVSCFIPNPQDRLSPNVYKKIFDNNLAKLKGIRSKLTACRFIANRNMQNVALDLNEESLARVCSEYSALMCEHYQQMHNTVIDYQEYPFESFGVSSIIFDLEYYKAYIRNRIIIDKLKQEGINQRKFNINALAKRTNPILQETLNEIHNFYNKQVTDTKASLVLKGSTSSSDIVGTIDDELKEIVNKIQKNIDNLLANGSISVFESEALLSLILGNDCAMFDTSAVDAKELIIDDIIDESADFFVKLDSNNSMLNKVSQDTLQQIRTKMRNIAVANRQREDRLNSLNIQHQASEIIRHIDGNKYQFGDGSYKIDLTIDEEPLEHTYEPHSLSISNIDLRNSFAPIRDQGQQGSCASFAVASVIEYLRHDSNRYSPAFLYWNARQAVNSTDKDSGASLYDVIKTAVQKGDCTEDLMPYNPDIYDASPTSTAFDEAMDCRILEAETVKLNLDDIKSALSDGYPVIVAVRIFDSFSETNSGFVHLPSDEELSNGDRKDGHASHAMVVCGFSDKEKIFVVRNSWGTRFGVDGYCYIPYSYAQQYFVQACIITEVTSSSKREGDKGTINFNLSDNNIEAAILQNLINEDKYELSELEQESTSLRTDWAHNIAVLGNVNNQTSLVNQSKAKKSEQIANEHVTISNLQSSEGSKIKEFKKSYIKRTIYAGLWTAFSWIMTYFFDTETISLIISIISTIVFIGMATDYAYRWRKYRQGLRDEIKAHANKIDVIKEDMHSLDIKAHIHGSILKDMNDYRLVLLKQYDKLKSFNDSLINYNTEVSNELEGMTPTVPYPFRAVLDNKKLDLYYTAWRNKMADTLDLKDIFAKYDTNCNIEDLIAANEKLNKSVVRGLRNFSMKEYISVNNRDKWQFLPSANKISVIIPDLDARAIPFCPYNTLNVIASEKYIFIKDITSDEMSQINRYFKQEPCAISDSNPYSISILNIIRYNIA
jgi:C1A family cysteine protease